jgi:hypothetical protein
MRHEIIAIEQRLGSAADWDKVDNLMMRVLVAAEKVARYRRAQLAAVRLSSDLNATVDNSTLEELLVQIKEEYTKLGPPLDLDVVGEDRLTAGSRAVERDRHPWA